MSSYWDDKAIDPPKKRKKDPVPISSRILRIDYVSTVPTVPPTERVVCHVCTKAVPPAQSYLDLGVIICLSCATSILSDYALANDIKWIVPYGNPDA